VGTGRRASQRLPSQALQPSSMAERRLRRQSPTVRATCGKAARVDLRGGCPVVGVPTAKLLILIVAIREQANPSAYDAAG
jgi:hypothetical protein